MEQHSSLYYWGRIGFFPLPIILKGFCPSRSQSRPVSFSVLLLFYSQWGLDHDCEAIFLLSRIEEPVSDARLQGSHDGTLLPQPRAEAKKRSCSSSWKVADQWEPKSSGQVWGAIGDLRAESLSLTQRLRSFLSCISRTSFEPVTLPSPVKLLFRLTTSESPSSFFIGLGQ